jgi:hypothetical protein
LGGIEQPINIEEKLVDEYFQRIRIGDMEGLLSLFSEDAVIDEPFSKSRVIGKSQIEMFLSTVIMANRDMHTEARIERKLAGSQIVVIASFQKSATLFGRFTFKLDDTKKSGLDGIIKALKIEFV